MEQQSNNAAKTISVVMLVTLLGKVMGLYRDRLLAVHYSVGVQANAFFTASRIPRVFFDAVFASAIAACFIPVFSEFLEKKGRKEAFRFARELHHRHGPAHRGPHPDRDAVPQVMVALFADYADPATTALAASLTRVMFPTVLFSGVAFSLVGVLQAQDRFTGPRPSCRRRPIWSSSSIFSSLTTPLASMAWPGPICWAGCFRGSSSCPL